jgi:hypothetical protein
MFRLKVQEIHAALVVDEWMNMKQWWNDNERGKSKYMIEKLVPMPYCPPKVPYGQAWNRNQAPTVKIW